MIFNNNQNSNQKSSIYYRVEQKIEQAVFLNFEKRFKNNNFRAFFVKS